MRRFLWAVFHLVRVMVLQDGQRHLPSQFVMYMEDELLSPLGRFLRDGSDLLRIPGIAPPELTATDQIVVLGGYLGDSTERYLRAFEDCTIQVLEPVQEYFLTLEARFKHLNVRVHEAAAWVNERGVSLAIASDSTGIYASGSTRQVSSVDLAKFLEGIDGDVGILEINIEGAEYELLTHMLLNSAVLPRVIFVQFHQISPGSHELRREVCQRLGLKYKCVFSYEWVWERWDLI